MELSPVVLCAAMLCKTQQGIAVAASTRRCSFLALRWCVLLLGISSREPFVMLTKRKHYVELIVALLTIVERYILTCIFNEENVELGKLGVTFANPQKVFL